MISAKDIFFEKCQEAARMLPALPALAMLLPRGWAGIRVLPRSERTGITSVTAQR